MIAVEIYYVLLGAGVGAFTSFLGNCALAKITERKETERTKSVLKKEFRWMYKILLNNLVVCDIIRNSEPGERDDFTKYSVLGHILVGGAVLDSLMSSGSILRLKPEEIGRVKAIGNNVAAYDNMVEWLRNRPERFSPDELLDTMNKIESETKRTIESLDSFKSEWIDMEKAKREAGEELKRHSEDWTPFS